MFMKITCLTMKMNVELFHYFGEHVIITNVTFENFHPALQDLIEFYNTHRKKKGK